MDSIIAIYKKVRGSGKSFAKGLSPHKLRQLYFLVVRVFLCLSSMAWMAWAKMNIHRNERYKSEHF